MPMTQTPGWPQLRPPARAKFSTGDEMDIQLLVRLGRMMPPRTLALSADIAAAKRLVGAGMIEITGQLRSEKRIPAMYAVYVRQITPAGLSAIAAEKERARGPSGFGL